MPVTSELCFAVRNWTGAETQFTTGFKAAAAIDVAVKTGAGVTLVRGVHFTSSLDINSNMVVTPLGGMPAAPQTLLIERVTPAVQPDTIAVNDTYSPVNLERRLNEAAMRSAENRRRIRIIEAATAVSIALTGITSVLAAQMTPPVTPANGDTYAVNAGATGAWLGQSGNTAVWSADAASWTFVPVTVGTARWSIASRSLIYNATATWLDTKVGQWKHLYDFLAPGVDPTGVTDWFAPLSAAAQSGMVVKLPGHVLPYSAKFTFTQRVGAGFEGEGYDTVLQPTFTNDDFIRIGDDVNGFVGYRFSNFRIWPTGVQQAGKQVFRAQRLTQSEFDNVWLGSLEDYGAAGGHRIAHGYFFERFADIVVKGQSQIVVAQDGVRMHGGDGTFGAEISLDERLRFLNCDTAVRVGGGCGGVYAADIDVSICGNGVVIDKTLSNVRNREVFLSDRCVLDLCSSYNLNIEGSAVDRVMIDGAWLASNSNAAGNLLRCAPVDGSAVRPLIHMTGGRLFNAQGTAANLNGCIVVLDGVEITDNGLAAGGGHGIDAPNANVDLIVRNCIICRNGNATKGDGIQTVAGVTGLIANNMISGNGQLGVDSPSTALEVRHNPGFATESRGDSQINGSASSVVINHGLARTPVNIQVTPKTILGASAVAYYRVTSITSTQFTVEANGALNATPWLFHWLAAA